MLVHIRPRFLGPYRNVALIDLHVDPLGLHLVGGEDLVTRRPYPNKSYAVACRKQGQKAIDGILIETDKPIDDLSTTARWAIEARLVVTHKVQYKFLDREFEAASDDMMLWHARSDWFGEWSQRGPAWRASLAPIYAEPVIEIEHDISGKRRTTEDILDDETGWITCRKQVFEWPTIERERLLSTRLNDRMPDLGSAFRV